MTPAPRSFLVELNYFAYLTYNFSPCSPRNVSSADDSAAFISPDSTPVRQLYINHSGNCLFLKCDVLELYLWIPSDAPTYLIQFKLNTWPDSLSHFMHSSGHIMTLVKNEMVHDSSWVLYCQRWILIINYSVREKWKTMSASEHFWTNQLCLWHNYQILSIKLNEGT